MIIETGIIDLILGAILLMAAGDNNQRLAKVPDVKKLHNFDMPMTGKQRYGYMKVFALAVSLTLLAGVYDMPVTAIGNALLFMFSGVLNWRRRLYRKYQETVVTKTIEKALSDILPFLSKK